MSTERPTPETDALVKAKKAKGFIDHARRLEQQRDEALQDAEMWRKHAVAALRQRDVLLEALEEMLHLCEHDFGMDESSPYIEQARSAIAAVKGNQ